MRPAQRSHGRLTRQPAKSRRRRFADAQPMLRPDRACQAESEYRTTRKTWRTARFNTVEPGADTSGVGAAGLLSSSAIAADTAGAGGPCAENLDIIFLTGCRDRRLGPPSVVGDDDIHLL